jgi:hypothetical protein
MFIPDPDFNHPGSATLIDIDPDWHNLDADPGLDPAK